MTKSIKPFAKIFRNQLWWDLYNEIPEGWRFMQAVPLFISYAQAIQNQAPAKAMVTNTIWQRGLYITPKDFQKWFNECEDEKKDCNFVFINNEA